MIKRAHEMTKQELTLVLARDEWPGQNNAVKRATFVHTMTLPDDGEYVMQKKWGCIGPIWERGFDAIIRLRQHVNSGISIGDSYIIALADMGAISKSGPESIARAIVAMRHPEGCEV